MLNIVTDGAASQEQWEAELAKELEDLGLGEEGSTGGEDGDIQTLEGEEQWENDLKLILDAHPSSSNDT